MKKPTETQIFRLLEQYNTWWAGEAPRYGSLPKRSYFDTFCQTVLDRVAQRAVVLLGARRVGKTVMLYQLVTQLLESGVQAKDILYVSVDNPLLHQLSLADLVEMHSARHGSTGERYLLLDEVQYQRDWDVQLKAMVDLDPSLNFVVTGSAAAALHVGSRESGAGRFHHFYLPALLFHEYLELSGHVQMAEPRWYNDAENIDKLNTEFINYLNYGAYPEAAANPEIGKDPGRYIGSDVIEKVLLRDLPSLYGIEDTRELNHLFSTLVFNSGQEVSPEGLSKGSGVSKTTLLRYLDYLESAFLISRVDRVDRSASRFKRRTHFKVYVQNPALYAATFGLVKASDSAMGALAETAIFMHWNQHESLVRNTYYARWKSGELDIVALDAATQRPRAAVEIKWSDLALDDLREIEAPLSFLENNTELKKLHVTTRTRCLQSRTRGVELSFRPTSVCCLHWGQAIFAQKRKNDSWNSPF